MRWGYETFGKIISEKVASKIIAVVSFVGILFAGRFVVPEIEKLLSGIHKVYTLGLPTCTYGLIFYILIFIVSKSKFSDVLFHS